MATGKDVLQRKYVLAHLNRERRKYGARSCEAAIYDAEIAWVKAQRKRATKPGGLGK